MRRSAILALACSRRACGADVARLRRGQRHAGGGRVGRQARHPRTRTDEAACARFGRRRAPITGLAWSPDGNRLALIAGGKLVVWDLPTGTSKSLPTDGDSDPVWSADGPNIGLRRGTSGVIVSADLGQERVEIKSLKADHFVWAPNLKDYVYTAHGDLFWSGRELFELASDIVDAPAFSPDAKTLTLVSSKPVQPFDEPGPFTRTPIDSGSEPKLIVAGTQPRLPHWAPDASELLYTADGEWKTVPAGGELRARSPAAPGPRWPTGSRARPEPPSRAPRTRRRSARRCRRASRPRPGRRSTSRPRNAAIRRGSRSACSS